VAVETYYKITNAISTSDIFSKSFRNCYHNARHFQSVASLSFDICHVTVVAICDQTVTWHSRCHMWHKSTHPTL